VHERRERKKVFTTYEKENGYGNVLGADSEKKIYPQFKQKEKGHGYVPMCG
jgi:hypothetical protein